MKPQIAGVQPLGSLVQTKMEVYLSHEYSDNTKKTYTRDLRQYKTFCDTHQLDYFLENSILTYLTISAETYKMSSLERKLVSLRQYFDTLPDVENIVRSKNVKRLMRSIRRQKTITMKHAPALSLTELQIVKKWNTSNTVKCRDKALFLVGFAGAFRVSELISVRKKDIRLTARGATVYVARSKTDQEGEGMYKALVFGRNPDFCPVKALEDWYWRMDSLLEMDDFLFPSFQFDGSMNRENGHPKAISRHSVNRKIKAYFGSHFSSHSMRAGFVTTAKENGADDASVMNQTGHKTASMIRKYSRHKTIFHHNAVTDLGF